MPFDASLAAFISSLGGWLEKVTHTKKDFTHTLRRLSQSASQSASHSANQLPTQPASQSACQPAIRKVSLSKTQAICVSVRIHRQSSSHSWGGGYSSVVEHLTVDIEIQGSNPICSLIWIKESDK